MKSIVSGLIVTIIIGAIALIVIRSTGLIKDALSPTDPSPSPSIGPNWTSAPSATPLASPTASPTTTGATTKGGLPVNTGAVKGTTTVKKTTTITTTTTTKLDLTILETSSCPLDTVSEVRDITGPLTLKYSLKDGYTATVTAWKTNGETLLPQTLLKNSGILKEISGVDAFKLQIVSKDCTATSDKWLKLHAVR